MKPLTHQKLRALQAYILATGPEFSEVVKEIIMATKIQWTEETWNPIIGCSKVSQGCKNCYAERMAKRIKAMGNPHYAEVIGDDGRWNGKIKLVESALDKPIKRKKQTIYFVNSMSDMFHKNVLQHNWAMRVWEIMSKTPQHTYQILTKRADLMAEVVPLLVKEFGILPNVWLGASIEDQSAASTRINWVASTPAAIKFLSVEPLLGPVDLELSGLNYGRDSLHEYIDWVIVGGESGLGARPCRPDWVRSIRDQCVESDVPFFFKQWGGTNKKAAGNLLDGKQWQQYPMVTK